MARTVAIMSAVAVVVCSRDRPTFLADTVRAIRADAPDVPLVVVDSASADPTAVPTAVAPFDVQVVRCETPGVSRARNAGWRSCDADVVAFTDDDCLPEEGWLPALIRPFDEATVDFVFGRVPAAADGGRELSLYDRPTAFAVADGADLRALGHAANLAVRRSALQAVGGFDERLGPGTRLPAGEDKALLWRLLRSGCRGWYAPDAVVRHRAWRGVRAALATSFRYGVGEGALDVASTRLGAPAFPRSPAVAALADALRAARERYEFGAAASLLRACGVVVGRRRAGSTFG
jgi:GT2 family glycosyltransferase